MGQSVVWYPYQRHQIAFPKQFYFAPPGCQNLSSSFNFFRHLPCKNQPHMKFTFSLFFSCDVSVPATVLLRKKILLTIAMCDFESSFNRAFRYISAPFRSATPCDAPLHSADIPLHLTLSLHSQNTPHCKRSSYFASLAPDPSGPSPHSLSILLPE